MGIKINIVKLGCPKNDLDAEALSSRLLVSGYELTEDKERADIFIVNTCAFIEEAKKESIETILKLSRLKNGRNNKKMIVTGCLAQRYNTQLWESMTEVDGFLGLNELDNITKICSEVEKGNRLCLISPLPGEYEEAPERTPQTLSYAYLRIADGCDNFCFYCSIPYIRGRFRSRKMDKILTEAESLAEKGIKEIDLIAQDITLYGQDIYGEKKLPELLSALSQIEKLEWIRLLYTHPAHYTEKLIQEIAINKKVCKYLDLPLQHISDKLLFLMNRKIDKKGIRGLLQSLRNNIPDLVLRTTFIVGLPGEGEEEFRELLDFVEEQRFDRLGVFSYSREEGTEAYKYKEHLTSKEKVRRVDRLMSLQQKIAFEKNEKRVGEKTKVLIESQADKREFGHITKKEKYYVARSTKEAPEIDGVILVKGKNLKIGEFVEVRITGWEGYDLVGELVRRTPLLS
ncbi:MAG: 30S ribosomal protein S12 methylthiotransferase RimO [candidate division Zixibacteria bacterium]|nr:30S ribosomal protein S12 methylthiotransferase RimO [candidate division Zixibacteria bacterium]